MCICVCAHVCVCVCVRGSIWALMIWVPPRLDSRPLMSGRWGSWSIAPSLGGSSLGPSCASHTSNASLPLSPAPSLLCQANPDSGKKKCLGPAISGRKVFVSFSSCSGIHPALGQVIPIAAAVIGCPLCAGPGAKVLRRSSHQTLRTTPFTDPHFPKEEIEALGVK